MITPFFVGFLSSINKLQFYVFKDINFWGSVYSTHYAVPHLRKSKGKIVAISSTAVWLSGPTLSFYNVRNLLVCSVTLPKFSFSLIACKICDGFRQARLPRYPFLRH
jgi:hypothetical protein